MNANLINPDFLVLKKNLKKDFSGLGTYKLAILGDSSTQFLNNAIRGYGYEVGLNIEIYESDYGQIDQEIYDATSGLYAHKPDCILIFHSSQKLLSRFSKCKENEKEHFAESHIQSLNSAFDKINNECKAKIIYFNFVELNDGVFGNYGNKVSSSFIFQLRKINFELMQLAMAHKNVFINDVCSLSSREGFKQTHDPKLYISGDFVFSLDFTARVAKSTVDIILSLQGKIKKCLILDLDNTIWGGVIGDDGMENIQIGDLGIGKAYSQLQTWIKQLKQRGIILAVCSKNTESIAKEPFEKHPDMVLKLDDISIFVANWESKVDNIKYIQSVLNIGFDSMVFLDDNPFERELIKKEIPAITVPDLPDDAGKYLDFVQSLNLFETASFSEEDAERTRQYQEEAKRVIFKQSHTSEEDYLSSLSMTSLVKPFDKFTSPRVAQLTQRSNQFNVRTVRYTEQDIAGMISADDYLTFSFDLKDRFGDHGLIAALILKQQQNALFIDTWVMSCRVLKRGMEQFIINEIVKEAQSKNINTIIGEYLPTSKNGIVKDLYPSLNFSSHNNVWVLDTANFTPFKIYINGAN